MPTSMHSFCSAAKPYAVCFSVSWISENLKRPVELEPISPAICIASSRLSEFHGDPADRLIVATAMTLGLPLMTADKKIIEWNKDHSAIQILNL